MSSKARKYDESDIKHFSGLNGVRKKPSMYIGPTDSHGIWILCKEAADNTTDEFLNGRNDRVHILEDKDKSIWVVDNGEGIPVGTVKTEEGKMSALKLILTKTHAGGKFDNKAYKTSIGTHGIGIKATNALSKDFEVYTFRDGKWWYTRFSKGVEKEAVKKVSKAPKIPHGVKVKKGTVIHFTPDYEIFNKGSKFNPKHAAEWCRLTAYLNANFETTFTDSSGKTKTWKYKNGVKDYIKSKLEELKCETLGKGILHVSEENLDLAVAFTSYDGVMLEAYTNSSKNVEGGVHVNAFYAALTKAIEPYKLKSHKFTSMDLREGVVGIINYKIDSPQFDSQTKEKLVDTRVAKPCEESCFKALKSFFSGNKSLAKEICRRAAELKALKDAFQNNKKALTELSKATKNEKFHPKHLRVDCNKKVRELYLVEGDSAFGPAKKARDKSFQEVMPLRGKILNVMRESKQDKAFDSEETRGIIVGTGYDPSAKDPMSKVRVNKLILLCDADPDGGHINSLILTLEAKYCPEMFEQGRVFIAVPPEYMTELAGKRIYGSSVSSVKKKTDGKAKNIRHYKGLGEMDEEILAETAFNPKTRKLLRVEKISKDDMKEFRLLMEDDPNYRKKMLGV